MPGTGPGMTSESVSGLAFSALQNFYFTTTPLALIGARHFSISLLTKPPR